MSDNIFKFKLCDILPYKKDDKLYARVILYCSFGYTTTIYTTQENAYKLSDICNDNGSDDVSDYIKVIYDNKRNQFAYYIKK